MTSKYLIWITLLLSFFSSGAFSQSRVIEDSLVYSDPTLSKGGGWIYGGSVDYWQVNMRYPSDNSNVVGTLNYYQPGASLFIGKGDLTVLLSYKNGSGDLEYPFDTSKITTTQTQLSLRYLLSDLSTEYVTPYVMTSYWDYELKSTQYFPKSPSTYYATENTKSRAPMIGGGGIFPFSKSFGLRLDGLWGITNSSGSHTRGNRMGNTGNITMLTSTLYYNVTENVNFQFGYQLTTFKPSANYNQTNRTVDGLYLKLGYTFK